MIWRLIHWFVAGQWGALLVAMLIGLYRFGDLPRSTDTTGHFETSFVLWMAVLLATTVASSVRASLIEDRA